jgi:hypothetical protein
VVTQIPYNDDVVSVIFCLTSAVRRGMGKIDAAALKDRALISFKEA